jgi:amino acid adenylation domain-containing protein
VVGTAVSGRTRSETEELIGFFANTLALRFDLSDAPSFIHFLGRVREVCLGAYGCPDVPLDKLVDELGVERSLAFNPLFQVMFSYDDEADHAPAIGNCVVTPLRRATTTSKFDLSLSINKSGDYYICELEYSTDLFDAATIERMAGHFRTLLDAALAEPDALVSKLSMLTEAERRQVLFDFNDTVRSYPMDKRVHQLFEDQVKRTPDSIAVVHGDKYLTYAELSARSNLLANYLRGLGVGPDAPVGIYMERSVEMVVGLLGVLKAGGAYVPVDTSCPPERIATILSDVRAPVLLIQERLLHKLPTIDAQMVCLDSDWELISRESDAAPDCPLSPENLAYIIYTSGSTGVPKGAGVYHRGVTNLLHWFTREFEIGVKDRVLMISSFGFDLTQKNIFGPLIAGACLHIPSAEHYDPQQIVDAIFRDKITVLNCTPTAFYPLVDACGVDAASRLSSLRLLMLGGEPINARRLQLWVNDDGFNTEIVNSYGPTECADVVAFHRLINCDPSDKTPIPIGGPVPNARLYVLDGGLQPSPVGVPGELCIAGDCVGSGYGSFQIRLATIVHRVYIAPVMLGVGCRTVTWNSSADWTTR